MSDEDLMADDDPPDRTWVASHARRRAAGGRGREDEAGNDQLGWRWRTP